MADLQLKLTIGDFEISIQGEGALVHTILTELRTEGLGILASFRHDKDINSNVEVDNAPVDEPDNTQLSVEESVVKSKTKNRKKGVQKTHQLVKELDLRGNKAPESLRSFVEKKKPTSNVQYTSVFVYYLQNILGINDIAKDHVFTCYREMNMRVPENLVQNLTDASSSRYGYLDRKDGKFSMSVKGSNFVEHDLPQKEVK